MLRSLPKGKGTQHFFQLTDKRVGAFTTQQYSREETGMHTVKENINREICRFGKIHSAVFFMDFYKILEWVKFCENSFNARFLIYSRTGTKNEIFIFRLYTCVLLTRYII